MTRTRRGTLRIIGGMMRGRRIGVPAGLGVRPTSDKVREALFSMLGPTVESLRVLDAYAGSGALGFEALSRGAIRVTFIEADPHALAILRRNAEGLGVVARCHILAGRVETVLGAACPGVPWDLVLADPPYAEGCGEILLTLLGAPGILSPSARVVFQRDERTPPATGAEAGFVLVRTARYGRNCLDFYQVFSPAGP